MKVDAGKQFFVRKVVISGLELTKPAVVEQRIPLKPGDPLDQTALLEMQRKLYDLALFNEVNAAIQNPNGEETYKNVLLNLTEAKRWDISYGFGFEVQTGTPSQSCEAGTGAVCNPNGHTGASPAHLVQRESHQPARYRPIHLPAHQLRHPGTSGPAQLPGSPLPR